jgi:hypothetical protein
LFLFDLFCVQDLDAHRLILDALVGPGRRDRDVFLDHGLSLEHDRNHLLRAECRDRRHGDGIEALLDNGNFHRTWGHVKRRLPFRVGLGRRAAYDDLRSRDRAGLRANDYLDFRSGWWCLRRLCERRRRTEQHKGDAEPSQPAVRHGSSPNVTAMETDSRGLREEGLRDVKDVGVVSGRQRTRRRERQRTR